MALTPLGRNWPKGYEPTEQEWREYHSYLLGMLEQTRAQTRLSLRTLAAAAVFLAVMGLVWWLT